LLININLFVTGDVDDSSPSEQSSVVVPQQSGAGPSVSDANNASIDQSGCGSRLNDDAISHIAALVAEKLNQTSSSLHSPTPQFRPVITNWKSFEKTEPLVTAGSDDLLAPANEYDNTHVKTDLNDQLDEKKVLRSVPKRHQANAKRLLKSFEARPDELSYDCQGVIFINRSSIPESNIFHFMPLLFTKKRVDLPGFTDFVNQIAEMGLDHLITYRPKKVTLTSQKIGSGDKIVGDLSSDPKNANWWYLGPP